MSNNLDAFSPEYWSRRSQAVLRRTLVSKGITNNEERAALKEGTKVHRPRYDVGDVQDYTKNVGIAAYEDATAVDEYLTIDKAKALPVFIDKIDNIQNKYKAANTLIDRATEKVKSAIDADVFNLFDQAFDTLDDGDVGGTAGNPVAASATNIASIVANAKAKLRGNDVEEDKGIFCVLGPDDLAIFEIYLAGAGFRTADEMINNNRKYTNGFVGKFFSTYFYTSNNLTFTAKLAIGTNPTADETVSVNGVTFKFVASPSAAGDVDLGANATASIANLVAAINGGSGAGTAYIEVSAADRKKLKNIAATAITGGLTIEAKGFTNVVVAETLSASGDAWSNKTTHSILGQFGCIDQVLQEEMDIEIIKNPINPATGKQLLGQSFTPFALYGQKVFNEGAQRMLDLQLKRA